ncbi:MAG: DUF1064 domain-containing protein [Oscillospiraceae bacterium]|nr:DUF1064 domain-containing protein [Oscillospiraceae bacterium]
MYWIKQSKYHAKKCTVGETTYDSKKEAKRGQELEYLNKIGVIKNLERQVKFELQPAYTNNQGNKIRPITYIADFVYEKNGKKIVEDTKGFKTDKYRIKKKIFEYKYPEYTFVES